MKGAGSLPSVIQLPVPPIACAQSDPLVLLIISLVR